MSNRCWSKRSKLLYFVLSRNKVNALQEIFTTTSSVKIKRFPNALVYSIFRGVGVGWGQKEGGGPDLLCREELDRAPRFPACPSPCRNADQPPPAPGGRPAPATSRPRITRARAGRTPFSSSSSFSSSTASVPRASKGSSRSYWATCAPVLGFTGVWRLEAASFAARCEAAIPSPLRPVRPRGPAVGKLARPPATGRLLGAGGY